MFFGKSHRKHLFVHSFQRHTNIQTLFFVFVGIFLSSLLFVFYGVHGSATTNFSMSILPQPLAVNIVDDQYNPIDDLQVGFTELSYARYCREITTQLISSYQHIYVRNFDAADSGWTVTISAENPSAVWSNGDYEFDFNDPDGSGCVDGDGDGLAGSMSIYMENPFLDSGLCPACSSDNVHYVPEGVFDEEESVNSVTLLYATADSDNRGDWRLSDIMVHQTIPASQSAVGDYELLLFLSIIAN